MAMAFQFSRPPKIHKSYSTAASEGMDGGEEKHSTSEAEPRAAGPVTAVPTRPSFSSMIAQTPQLRPPLRGLGSIQWTTLENDLHNLDQGPLGAVVSMDQTLERMTDVYGEVTTRAFQATQLGYSGHGFWPTIRWWMQTIEFQNAAMEHRFMIWAGLKAQYGLRLAALCIFLALFVGLVATLISETLRTRIVIWRLAVMVGFNFLTLISCWSRQWETLITLGRTPITRRGVAVVTAFVSLTGLAVLCAQASIAVGDFTSLISVGSVVTLFLFLSIGLECSQPTMHIGSWTAWAAWVIAYCLIPGQSPQIAVRFICVALAILCLTRACHNHNVEQRFEFYLHLNMFRYIGIIQHSQDALQEQRMRAVRAQAAQETHKAIMGYACHELRNPLHGLRGCLAEVRERCRLGHVVDEDDVGHIDGIESAASQMGRITDDILDFHKLQAGKLKAVTEPFDIRAVVKRVLVQYNSREAQVPVEIDPGVPSAIESDQLRVAQVLTNGVTNALKHTAPDKTIQVKCFLREQLLHVEVWNEGKGLGGVDVNTLFELYERGADETNTSIQGIGLGLPICRMLMRLLGGEVGLEDRGSFTVFWFWVPLHGRTVSGDVRLLLPGSPKVNADEPDSSQADSTDSTPLPSTVWAYWSRPTSSRVIRRVLVVDDQSVNRRVLLSMMRRLGCQAVELTDGDEVAAHLRTDSQFDMVFMDIFMIRTDGRNIVRHLRSIGCAIPMIATTGNCSAQDVESYREAGFNGMLAKPFTLDDVRSVIHSATHGLSHQFSTATEVV